MAEVFVNWGDSSGETVTLSGSPVSIHHEYINNSGYVIEISGRTSQMSGMTLSGCNITQLSGFSDNRINISSLNVNNNKFTILPVINSKLKHLYLNNSISGATSSVPNYSDSTLETLQVNNNNLNGYMASSLPATMHSFSADDNNINTSGVTNIINNMYTNNSSKIGMSISLINNGTLLDTSKKYDLIDNSGSTVNTMGKFGIEIKRSDGRESGHTFTMMITKPTTSKNIKCHIDYGDASYIDIILSGSSYYSNYSIINRTYSSGSSSMTYYPAIESFLDDITALQIFNTHNNSATLNTKEFPNLTYLNLPYYGQDYYYGYQQGYYMGQFTGQLDLSRNIKMQHINFPYHNFTSMIWPKDVSNFTHIQTTGNYTLSVTSPRIDLMPNLIRLDMGQNNCTGTLYPPNASKKLTYYDMGWNWTLSPGPIPDFTDCTGLTYVNLGGTSVNSNGSTNWSTLTNLDELNISNNSNLTGSMPDFTMVSKMRYLNISYNGYQDFGNHTNWDSLTGLTQLYITGNQNLVDTFPNLTGSTELMYLNLYNNKLCGQFPDISHLKKLTQLAVQGNILTNEFPVLTANTSLTYINFGGNRYNDFGTNYGISDIKILPDGKILVGGQFSSYSGQTTNKIVKLNSDGTINNTFDNWNRFTDYNSTNEQVSVIEVQPDGKILIGGNFASYSGVTCYRLIRLNSGGTIDNSFNIGTGFQSGEYINAIAVQPDGKIIVGGYFNQFNGSSTYRHLIRLDSGGTLDPDWNPMGGIANGSYAIVHVIKLQPDGKILVGGYFQQYDYVNTNSLVRLTTGGTFDSTFDYTDQLNTTVKTLEIQSDNKILVGGSFTTYGSHTTRYITRLNSGGTFDSTFDSSNGFNGEVSVIKQQVDGKILVGGQFYQYSGQTYRNIIRLNSDGTIDTTFNTTNGIEECSYSWYSEVKAIGIQTDGKVLIAGKFYSYSGTTANKIIRLNGDGTIDNTFVIGSNRTIPDLSYNTNLTEVDFNSCGLNTWFNNFPGSGNMYNLNLRNNNFIHFPDFSNMTNLSYLYLDSNAIIDDLSASCSLSNTTIRSLLLSSNRLKGSIPMCWSGLSYLTELNLSNNMISGGIPEFFSTMTNLTYFNLSNNNITSGLTYLSGRTDLRYLDVANNNFSGTTMFDMTNFNNLYYLNISSCGMVGDIKVSPNVTNVNYYYLSNNNFTGNMPPINSNYTGNQYIYDVTSNFFTEYTPMVGSQCWLDYAYFSYNYLPTEEINKLVIDVSKSQKNNGYLSLYGPNMGTITGQALLDLENLYAKNWQITYNLPVCDEIGYIKVITKQPDNKLLLGGDFTSYSGVTAKRIIRLNTDYTIDNTFDSSYGFDGMVNDIKVQSNGKIVVGGEFTTYSGQTCNRIIRLNNGGTIDTSFSIGYGFNQPVTSIAIQQDGKIVVGGMFTDYSGTTQQFITRLNSGGTIDSTFSIGNGFNSYVYSVIIQSGGTIVVGGSFTQYNGNSKNHITRLDSDGTFDTSFGGGAGFNSQVNILTQQSDGKILVGGQFNQYNNSTQCQYLTRLNYNGSMDNTFITTSPNGFNQYVSHVSVQDDGKIIVVGDFTSYSGITANRIIRLNTDATHDATFNTQTGFNQTFSTVFYSYVNDGKILLSGKYTKYSGITSHYLTILNSDSTINNSSTGLLFDNGNSVTVDSISNMINFKYAGSYNSFGLVYVNGMSYIVASVESRLVWDLGGSGEYTFTTYVYTTITRNLNGTNYNINYYQGYTNNYYLKIKLT